jgi:hypothetical protein
MGVEKMSKTRKVEAFFLEAVKGGWVAGLSPGTSARKGERDDQ